LNYHPVPGGESSHAGNNHRHCNKSGDESPGSARTWGAKSAPAKARIPARHQGGRVSETRRRVRQDLGGDVSEGLIS